ncbi:MAG: helix-turn-helix domain-containing protein [Tolypothrix carrinoi HA7290-LM1]|jgi:transcriptional regulator with XRE-family HTH domain|nr:helix-turn-helix domain-containing protein [Tolypothrix carrinoi HA7290-LM1]
MEEKPLAVRLGILIRQLRLQTKMSQEEFADLCGLHRTYIGFIERGEKTITIETANKIAQALGLTLAQLFQELDRVDPS